MNNFESRRKEIKDRALNILERDRRNDNLESLIHNYSKEKKQDKILMSREEFFKEKENE